MISTEICGSTCCKYEHEEYYYSNLTSYKLLIRNIYHRMIALFHEYFSLVMILISDKAISEVIKNTIMVI
jgi:hypothetical protein